jgi:DNA-binding LacI/PurR family transcriptional regulator
MAVMDSSGDSFPAVRPGPGPRATIDDVASAAGVSRQTVSNVVRGRGRVSSTTRDRVRAVIRQLGYEPHLGAASLRSGRTFRIAYPIPDTELGPDNVIMLEFLQVLVAAARLRKHQLLVVGSGHPLDGLGDLITTGSVDGFVFATSSGDDPRAAFLAERQVPFACFGRIDPPLSQHWVDIDNRAAVRQVTAHVLAGGHTQVAYLGYTPQGRWDLERECGYYDAMKAAGLDPVVTRTAIAPAETGTAVAALLRSADRPTAVITGSDRLAAACYTAAAAAGLRIGPDLAVTGFDGSLVSRMLTPALTTVAIPLADIAARLIDRVIDQVNGAPQEHGEIIGTSLRHGQSSPGR